MQISFPEYPLQAVVFSLLMLALNGRCEKQQEEVCMTSGCIQSATEILESLDKNINPCDNFYQFACGNAIKKIVVSDDKLKVDSFDIIGDKIREQLHTILKQKIEENEIRPITLVKKYFQACMNEEIIEKRGLKIITDLLADLGGWPVLDGDSWNDKGFNWAKLIYKFRKMGLETKMFIDMTVDPDPTNSTIRIVELDQPRLGFPRELLTTGTKVEPYLGVMVNISVHLGADRLRAEKELKESLDFEIQLAKFSLSTEDRSNISKLIHHMTINELQKTYPNTQWLEYINTLLPAKAQLKGDDVILVVVPKYFSSMEKLIAETPKRVQANYALWRIIKDLTAYLPKEIYDHILNASRIIDGQAERPLRWKECTEEVTKSLPLLVSSLYVRKYFDEDAKNNAVEMIKYIKAAFNNILETLEWMDDATQQKAIEKSHRIAEHIGYPDELLDDKLLEKYYEKLEVYPDQYLKSRLNIDAHKMDVSYKRLHEPVNKRDWTDHGYTATAAAYYIPLENGISFPAGILQGMFFNKNRPRYMNFGAIGSIIGHEITHGFDDLGRQFDVNGNVVNWWAAETEKLFLEKTQCMIYQYGNYTVPEVNKTINGIKTQGENIADNGGIKEAYLAYNAWAKNNSVEPKLPNLDYSPNQLFWISAAMNWCASYKLEYLQNVVALDTHSPNEFRVLGPFSNSKEFASDFNCPVDSKMNPKHKCAVW